MPPARSAFAANALTQAQQLQQVVATGTSACLKFICSLHVQLAQPRRVEDVKLGRALCSVQRQAFAHGQHADVGADEAAELVCLDHPELRAAADGVAKGGQVLLAPARLAEL